MHWGRLLIFLSIIYFVFAIATFLIAITMPITIRKGWREAIKYALTWPAIFIT